MFVSFLPLEEEEIFRVDSYLKVKCLIVTNKNVKANFMNNIYIIIRYFKLMLMFNYFTQKQFIFQLRRHINSLKKEKGL